MASANISTRSVSAAFRSWWTSGTQRVANNFGSALRAAVAAALAYFISQHLWGHEQPFFSAITAFVLIGFTKEAKTRKVFELSLGVMLGIGIGEVARATIGPGTWQITVVILVAGLLARMIDKSIIFAFQASIQGLLIMLAPFSDSMRADFRIVDAITGVVVALVVHLLLSGDPRRVQRRAAEAFFESLETTLTALAESARTGDSALARETLKAVREKSQALTDEWKTANTAANDLASYSPSGLRHAQEVHRIEHLLVGSDRAMRNIRVIARRQVVFLEAVAQDRYSTLGDALKAGQEAVEQIRHGIESDVDFTEARRRLRLFCSYLTPEMLLRSDEGLPMGRIGHFEGVALVVQLRSLAMDLLEATGLETSDAQRFLPSLLVASDDDVIGPRPVTREMKAIEPPATTAALEILIADRTDPHRRGLF